MKWTIFISVLFLASAASANAAPSYFSQIDALALPSSTSGQGVTVAVLDSGVDIDHSDLNGSIWINKGESIYPDGLDNDNNGYIDDIWGWDFTIPTDGTGRNDPRPKYDRTYDPGEFSHGTAIAGYVAAKENIFFDTAGLAPQAKVMALRVLKGNGEGEVSQVVDAIKYAVNNGANIINLSFVGPDNDVKLEDAVKWAYDHNVVVVAAAGNGLASSTSGVNLNIIPAYPACYSSDADKKHSLAVASVDSSGKKSSFSNFGSNCINISAPGESLRGLAFSSSTSGELGSGYAVWSGTSFSAALVSAGAALLKSARHDLSAGQIIDILIKSASSLSAANPNLNSGELGSGQLDVKAALKMAMAIQPAQLIKTKDFPAVYFVDTNGIRHLFVTGKIYDSWFSAWKIRPVINVISQDAFDAITAGANMTVRPGHLIKFNSSPAIYEVLSDNSLCRVANSSASLALFGINWQNKIVNSSLADYSNYTINSECILTASSFLPAVFSSELISAQ